ncbi:MAG TPA: transposase [Ilumatobacteraceae bacterium]|nr:transposase [Ilumatobacteraceae bacterium]
MLERQIHRRLRHDRGYQAVQAINGVGRTIAAIIVVEVGDVTRFPTPRHPSGPLVAAEGCGKRSFRVARL